MSQWLQLWPHAAVSVAVSLILWIVLRRFGPVCIGAIFAANVILLTYAALMIRPSKPEFDHLLLWGVLHLNIVIVPFCLWTVLACRLWGRRHPDDGWPRCDNCGYNLTGNVSGVCPECGQRIEA